MSGQLDIPPEQNLIYHVATQREWNQAQKTGVYDRSTRGKSFDEVGFIHAPIPIDSDIDIRDGAFDVQGNFVSTYPSS